MRNTTALLSIMIDLVVLAKALIVAANLIEFKI